jgi:hypothetical protein
MARLMRKMQGTGVEERLMARERVDDFAEAKELSKEHKRVHHDKVGPDIHAGQLQVHGASGTSMDGIAADIDQLITLSNTLQGLRDQLSGHLATAAQLTEPLADGSSPVTGPMRKAFLQRADVDEGVQGTLTQYIEELDAVRQAISDTLLTYTGVDTEAGSRFDRLVNGEESDR